MKTVCFIASLAILCLSGCSTPGSQYWDGRYLYVHLGVWGARKTAKFRNALKQSGVEVEIIKSPPPGRLVWYEKK